MSASKYVIILFYKFIRIENPAVLRDEQKALAKSLGLSGRMLIAQEGVNATFEGTKENITAYQTELRKNPLFADVVFKESEGTGKGFSKLEVKVRKEVVTLGAGDFDVQKETAAEITPDQLEEMYAKEDDFVVLDLRNTYEIEAGRFENTVHPELKNFRDLPQKISQISHLKKKKIVAVCTGGIRCEKATCLLKKEGFEKLYQLKDGIHAYMQKYPGKRFKGSLFVFDNRMTTPIVDTADREIVGECAYCGVKCEEFYNDDSERPSIKVICCGDCIPQHSELRPVNVLI